MPDSWGFVLADERCSKTYDRASGKVRGELVVESIQPDFGKIPQEFKGSFPGIGETVRFENLDRLMALAPLVVLKNEGEEPFDVLRVEIRMRRGIIDSQNLHERSAGPADTVGVEAG